MIAVQAGEQACDRSRLGLDHFRAGPRELDGDVTSNPLTVEAKDLSEDETASHLTTFVATATDSADQLFDSFALDRPRTDKDESGEEPGGEHAELWR